MFTYLLSRLFAVVGTWCYYLSTAQLTDLFFLLCRQFLFSRIFQLSRNADYCEAFLYLSPKCTGTAWKSSDSAKWVNSSLVFSSTCYFISPSYAIVDHFLLTLVKVLYKSKSLTTTVRQQCGFNQ